MKLLLTSTGFSNKKIAETFLGLFNKSAEKIRLIFIPTASRTKEEMKYVEESRQELIDLGINQIITLNLDHQIKKKEVDNADVIYVCGGNTFYLLKKIHDSGFGNILHGYKGIYIGVSAGSIVVGPNIEVSTPWDENDVNLTDTTGLNIVNFAVIPHYQRKDQSVVEKLKKQAKYDVVTLTDNQAVLVINSERKIIGE